MKKAWIIILAMMLILTSCSGGNQAPKEDWEQNPKAVAYTDSNIFYYGSPQDTIEKIIGAGGEPAIKEMDHYLVYPDDTQILYREEQAVLMMFEDRQYSTYQGISVGDKWDEVKDKLGEVAEVKNMALILFDGDMQIDPWIKGEDREDDWLSISYWMGEDGLIDKIAVSDNLAAITYK